MLKKYFKEASSLMARGKTMEKDLTYIILALYRSLKEGGKILIAGNGGSAADAQHFAAELVGRYKKERRGLPAIALSTDTSILTACANDFGYTEVFDRQVDTLGNEGDVFVGISTSGYSDNIILALERARSKGLVTVGLLGGNGGIAKRHCDYEIVVPSKNTPRIQEMHILLIHIICEELDKMKW